jgi:hypothetical protein
VLVISVCGIATPARALITVGPSAPPADFNNIQDAIDAASEPNIIEVNDGTYTGPGNYDIDTKGKEITVKSQNGPGNCIIDCQSNGRAFIFQSGEDANTILQGFTIKNGFAFDPSPPYDPNDDPDGFGGAIYCTGSSPMIKNCAITDNEADYGGGGIFCDESSDPCITSCDIKYNYCGSYRFDVNQVQIGGGIYCRNSGPAISNCNITENWVEGWWKKGSGGGVAYENSNNALIVDCNIIDNECWALEGEYDDPFEPNYSQDGGGIYVERSNLTISDCTLADNFANYSGGGIAAWESITWILGCSVNYNICGASGGGIYSVDNPAFFDPNSPPTLLSCYMQNCLITKNKGYWGGGVASSYDSFAAIINCTIAKNNVDYPELYAGGLRCKNGWATVINSIIWGNAGKSISAFGGVGGTVRVRYSDVQIPDNNDPNIPNVSQGEGNINEDPLFADPIRYDYHLQSEYGRWNPDTGLHDINDPNTSPCIDAGNPFADFSNEPEDNGDRINMGAYGNTTQASLSGAGVIRYVPADLDEDGDVDIFDWIILFDNWLLEGAAINNKRADINNDGIVNFTDLAIFNRFWPWP